MLSKKQAWRRLRVTRNHEISQATTRLPLRAGGTTTAVTPETCFAAQPRCGRVPHLLPSGNTTEMVGDEEHTRPRTSSPDAPPQHNEQQPEQTNREGIGAPDVRNGTAALRPSAPASPRAPPPAPADAKPLQQEEKGQHRAIRDGHQHQNPLDAWKIPAINFLKFIFFIDCGDDQRPQQQGSGGARGGTRARAATEVCRRAVHEERPRRQSESGVGARRRARARVRFSKQTTVILVASRMDLSSVKTDIWWGEKDYSEFRRDCLNAARKENATKMQIERQRKREAKTSAPAPIGTNFDTIGAARNGPIDPTPPGTGGWTVGARPPMHGGDVASRAESLLSPPAQKPPPPPPPPTPEHDVRARRSSDLSPEEDLAEGGEIVAALHLDLLQPEPGAVAAAGSAGLSSPVAAGVASPVEVCAAEAATIPPQNERVSPSMFTLSSRGGAGGSGSGDFPSGSNDGRNPNAIRKEDRGSMVGTVAANGSTGAPQCPKVPPAGEGLLSRALAAVDISAAARGCPWRAEMMSSNEAAAARSPGSSVVAATRAPAGAAVVIADTKRDGSGDGRGDSIWRVHEGKGPATPKTGKTTRNGRVPLAFLGDAPIRRVSSF